MLWVIAWLKAFVLTELIEIPIVVALTRGAKIPFPRRAALAFFASLATHPAVWFIFPELNVSDGVRVALSEAWACVAEAVFYKLVFGEITFARAIGVSVVANSSSFSFGLVLRALTGWV